MSRTAPPAIWTAFAQQGRWKNWVMLGQLLLLALMTQVTLKLARTEPDVVVVDASGDSHYVERAAASAPLLDFLATQRGAPSDVTVEAFTRRFLKATAAPNSTMLDEQWAEALSMMAAPLAERVDAEARAQKLLETYRLAQVRTLLDVQALDILERHGSQLHLRARIHRRRESLVSAGAAPTTDSQQVDLVLSTAPRSRLRPDGLVVVEWRTTPLPEGMPSQPPASP
jgi:hypothetical protein